MPQHCPPQLHRLHSKPRRAVPIPSIIKALLIVTIIPSWICHGLSWSRTACYIPSHPDAFVHQKTLSSLPTTSIPKHENEDDDENRNNMKIRVENESTGMIEMDVPSNSNNNDDENGNIRRCFDLSSPRDWMEYIMETTTTSYSKADDKYEIKIINGKKNNAGVGAYTVIRCEKQQHRGNNNNNKSSEWNIWGEEFHLDRLKTSYDALLRVQGRQYEQQSQDKGNALEEQMFRNAIHKSRMIMNALLREADSNAQEEEEATMMNDCQDGAQVVMLTLLWTTNPPSLSCKKDVDSITVRGHICRVGNGPIYPPISKPRPIVASIAVASPSSLDLPNRHDSDPHAKLSSWCRDRRPLEDTNVYKPPGIGEVILTRSVTDTDQIRHKHEQDDHENIDIELLEGLTSNLFVIYNDGTLRTAPKEDVLNGYARTCILSLLADDNTTAREKFGIAKVELKAPLLEDAKMGLWSEVFTTSAIRLITPVEKIVIPNHNILEGNGGAVADTLSSSLKGQEVLWSAPPFSLKPRWETLYHEILRRNKTSKYER